MKKNRLANETSPYLLQHQNNPVDWYPWGEEALARARSENKPILLSIGYSACHWCHVMAHECFEDINIAKIMNDHFINIKVDREERPDLDHIYQNVSQAMTRSGGWPLTVFLTPELKPFFGGTYFPPEDKYGRPGFPRLLLALSNGFQNEKESIDQNVNSLMEYISQIEKNLEEPSSDFSSFSLLTQAADRLLQFTDSENGGFKGAPKFPHSMVFSFLWRMGNLTNSFPMKERVYLTLREMASKGLYDQLGGGFHRYCVDEYWNVPHFEKMLYDNGLLLKLYSEVLLTNSSDLTQDDQNLFFDIIEKTVQYIFREMLSPEGLFYSAQDADTEGEEGKFFVWDLEDLSKHLAAEEAKVFALRYGVTFTGNFEDGKTVLHQAKSLKSINDTLEKSCESILKSACNQLFQIRSTRVAPGLDYKSLASWNGLMISGLAWASEALSQSSNSQHIQLSKKTRETAIKAFETVLEKFKIPNTENFYSTFQIDEGKGNAFLDDYSFLAMAALDLSRFENNPEKIQKFIRQAEVFSDIVLKHFSSSEPGYYFTSDTHEKLIYRPKILFDQAIPSGIAVILQVMNVLSECLEGEKSIHYKKEVENQLKYLKEMSKKYPSSMGELLNALLLSELSPVIVSGQYSKNLSSHFMIYQKFTENLSSGKTIFCHRGECSRAFKEFAQVKETVFNRFIHFSQMINKDEK